MGRTGVPLKLSTIASRGGLAAIREGLGFPNYGYKAKPDLTPGQTRAASKILTDTSGIGTVSIIEMDSISDQTNEIIKDIMRDSDADETGLLPYRELRGTLAVQESKMWLCSNTKMPIKKD